MKSLLTVLTVFLCALALSCTGGGAGSSGGGGGGGGTSDTGTLVTASIVPGDINVDYCKDEGAGAEATLTADIINSSLPSNTLTTESYRLTFTPLTAGAPHITGGAFPDSRTLPADGFGVAFVDTTLKQSLRQELAATGAAHLYRATYKFTGEDLYGTTWSASGNFTFNVGKYSTCPLALSPASATVTGINNPDGDPSDDVLFTITGGTQPYTVYSDSLLINAPGALGDGVASFIADAAQADVPTDVTITVVDTDGASTTATVTVTPP